MPSSLPVNPGEIFAGKYRIDDVIGEGGMGVVLLAQHLELDQPVAIKFLLDTVADSAEGAERFRREARAAAKIQSDHVARVYDVGILPTGERYMVMEYLKGKDLADELAIRGRFPVAYGARLMLEVLEAVSEAHAAGIVHRDLKPGNVFLAQRPDGRIRVKVLDFGISKAVGLVSASELSLTKTSAWIGSPLYMAPEQMQSARDVDSRADIWSFGAIFYEVLTGEPPYIASSLPQLCALLLSQDPAPVSQKCGEIPYDLEQLVMRCLMRDPNARYQSVSELMMDLQLVLGRISGAGRDSATGPGSLAPIASRLPLVPAKTSAGIGGAGTVLAEPHLAGATPVTGEQNPTNGTWSSSAQQPVGGGAALTSKSNPSAPSKKFATVLALLSLGVAASVAWYAFRPHGGESLAPSVASDAPESPEPSVRTVPVDAVVPVVGPAEPSPSLGSSLSPSPGPSVAEDPPSDPLERPRSAGGGRRPASRPGATSALAAAEEPTVTPQPEPSPPPVAPIRTSEPKANEEFDRFGGRR
jgi:eukaryotic-like serine/threonine-protein kinase